MDNQIVDIIVRQVFENYAEAIQSAQEAIFDFETGTPYTRPYDAHDPIYHSDRLTGLPHYRHGPWSADARNGLTAWRDVANLAKTCKNLYYTVTPILYTRDVELNNASALLLSARSGNLRTLYNSLANGADVDTLDHTLPQMRSCFADHNATLPCVLNFTALHWAANELRGKVVAILLNHGANIDQRSDVFDDAAGTVEVDGLTTCESVGRCCNKAGRLSRSGASPLYYALSTGNQERTDVVDNDEYGVPAEGPALKVARRLIDAGASLITHRGFGTHAIHQAVRRSAPVSFIRYLLEDRGVDPDVRDGTGSTAVHHLPEFMDGACFRPALGTLCLLAEHGADLDAVDRSGRSAIWQTCPITGSENRVSSQGSRLYPDSVQLEKFFALIGAGAKLGQVQEQEMRALVADLPTNQRSRDSDFISIFRDDPFGHLDELLEMFDSAAQ